METKRVRYTIEDIPLRLFKPDLLQPRKRYDPAKLEELAASVREKGLINMPIAEKMTSNQYRAYVIQYPESSLKQKLLSEIKDRETFYLDVIGHRRYISALKAGLNRIKAKVITNLSLLERRMIQNHEASQLSFTPWAKAKSSYELYQLMKEQKEAEGKTYSTEEFARYMGWGKETVRERFKYVKDVLPEVKKLVEKEKTVKYTNAVLIASSIKDPKKQFRYAVTYGNRPEREVKEVLKEGPKQKFELGTQTQIQTDDKKNQLSTIKDRLYKLIKLREVIPSFGKAFESDEIRKEYGKLEGKLQKFEEGLGQKELLMLQLIRSPKIQCGDTRHLEKLEVILEKAYLENERNRLEKDPEIGGRLIKKINLRLIDPDLENPRGEYEEGEMELLAESIREVGLLNPILLEKTNGRYKLVVGHRRKEAVTRAGYKTIESFVVQDLPKQLRLYLQVVEDSQVPFTNDERANSWTQLYDLMSKKLKKDTVLTILEFSRRIGKSQKVVRTAIRYEKMLSENVKRMVEEGLLAYSRAIPLTKMINLDKDDKTEIERMKKWQYELAINAAIGGYTEERMKKAVKEKMGSKQQIDLFPNNHKQALESLTTVLQQEALWNMKSLNSVIPRLKSDENTLKKICSLERTLRLI